MLPQCMYSRYYYCSGELINQPRVGLGTQARSPSARSCICRLHNFVVRALCFQLHRPPPQPQPPASLPVSHSALTPSAAAYTKKKGTNHAYSPGIDSQSARPHWKADAHTHAYARTHTGKLERQWQHDSVDPSPCFPCPLPELVLALELPLAAPGGEIQAGRHPQWRCETVSLFPQPAVSCHAAPLNSSWQRRPREPTVGSIRLDCVKLTLRRDYWGKTVLI